jgi:hypothetical protein
LVRPNQFLLRANLNLAWANSKIPDLLPFLHLVESTCAGNHDYKNICPICGGTNETAEHLEKTVNDARQRHRQVEVAAYMPS